MAPICQCQPRILVNPWRPYFIHSLCGPDSATARHAPPGPVGVPAAPRSLPLTLTPRQLLARWQQPTLAASTKSFLQHCLHSAVAGIAVSMMKCRRKCCCSLYCHLRRWHHTSFLKKCRLNENAWGPGFKTQGGGGGGGGQSWCFKCKAFTVFCKELTK